MKKCILIVFALYNIIIVNAQDALYRPDILPHSPEGAAFAKNVNIPMNYTSGVPSINIPFYSLKSGSMEIPVSISYNASGIRVEEVPTWVGLGWNLNGTGQISRTVRGIPDETPSWGYMKTQPNRYASYVNNAHCRCNPPTTETAQIDNDLDVNHLDLEPDEYTFSVMGYSGSFYYNQDSAKFICLPFQNIKIEQIVGSFLLTMPNGIKCYFGETSASTEVLTYGSTASYLDYNSYAPVDMQYMPQTNGWMITTIQDPEGRQILFNYSTEQIITFGRGGERYGQTLTDSYDILRRQSFFKQIISKPVIQKITADNGIANFNKSVAHRIDMPDSYDGSRALESIQFATTNGVEIKSFYFNYGYFTSPAYPTGNILNINTYSNEALNRLYLKSVTEKNGTDSLPPYQFTYSNIELPSRFSTAQDYWGYYNGKTNGQYLIPRIPSLSFNPLDPDYNSNNQILPPFGSYQFSYGADRRVDTNYSQARILKSIKYPTGGSTDYTYEHNDVAIDYMNIYGGLQPSDAIDKSYVMGATTTSSAPYPTYFSGTFHVNFPVTKIRITPQLTTCGLNNDASCVYTVKLTRVSDNTLLYSLTTTAVVDAQLTTGDYLVEVLSTASSNDPTPFFQINFDWSERTDALNFLTGGVRIKKIVSRDGLNNSLSRSFSYLDETTNKSSGVLEGIPTYRLNDRIDFSNLRRQYYVNNSAIPLTSDGKSTRYTIVTEYLDSLKSSLKTKYSFTSGLSDPRKFGGIHYGEPLTTWNWQNSLLGEKQVFEKTAPASYRLLTDEKHFFVAQKPSTLIYGLYGTYIIAYSVANEWYMPDYDLTTTYSYQTTLPISLSQQTNYGYNNYFIRSKTTTTNSKGQAIQSKIWYPTDYNNVTGFNIPAINANHIYDIPMKQEVSVNGKVKSGTITKYNSIGQPLEGYSYENPVLSDSVNHDPTVVVEANYQLKTSLGYDQSNNVRQINNNKSGPATYVWDYQINNLNMAPFNMYPIAMVQNADSFNVAYTSFENLSQGGWSFSGSPSLGANAVTGINFYSLNAGNISKSNLSSSTNYIVSYWGSSQQTVSNTVSMVTGRTFNGMTYYEHHVSNPSGGTVTVSGSGNIDELRLFPEKAQMVTYTYNSNYDLSAQCDANNKITYYEYDTHKRLSLLKDQNKNIIKKYCYNYSGQAEGCGLGTDAQWQASSGSCENNAGINTGNYLLVFKDTNPNSSTYNQVRNSTESNSSSCPVCISGNCIGEGNKCVNNYCEMGTKVYSGCARTGSTSWTYYYHYVWSDSSFSSDYTEIHSTPCAF